MSLKYYVMVKKLKITKTLNKQSSITRHAIQRANRRDRNAAVITNGEVGLKKALALKEVCLRALFKYI